MDTRTDDCLGEVQVRSDDNEEITSIELFGHQFRVNDATGEVRFADDAARDEMVSHIEQAIFKTVWHECRPPTPAAG